MAADFGEVADATQFLALETIESSQTFTDHAHIQPYKRLPSPEGITSSTLISASNTARRRRLFLDYSLKSC